MSSTTTGLNRARRTVHRQPPQPQPSSPQPHASPALPPRELITPADIVAHARQLETRRRVVSALRMLENDPIDESRLDRYAGEVAGSQGRTARSSSPAIQSSAQPSSTQASSAQPASGQSLAAPIDCLLDCAPLAHAAAELLGPRRAIEIGVRRGFCAAAIAAACPDVELHLVDRWPGRGADQDADPVLVRRQLQAVAHRGHVHFHQGDSHVLLPQLYLPYHHAPLTFDLAVVDGDRSEIGADKDLRDIFPHIARGGVVIFDNLAAEHHGHLLDVWRRWQSRLADQFAFAEFPDESPAIGLAMRLTD